MVQASTTLTARADFAPLNAPAVLSLQVLRTVTVKVKITRPRKGKRTTTFRLSTRTTVLYAVRTHGQTGRCGNYQGRVRVTYRAPKSVTALLTLQVGTGKHRSTATTRVTIRPGPKATPRKSTRKKGT
jgi:hypothetical protein